MTIQLVIDLLELTLMKFLIMRQSLLQFLYQDMLTLQCLLVLFVLDHEQLLLGCYISRTVYSVCHIFFANRDNCWSSLWWQMIARLVSWERNHRETCLLVFDGGDALAFRKRDGREVDCGPWLRVLSVFSLFFVGWCYFFHSFGLFMHNFDCFVEAFDFFKVHFFQA